MRPDSLVRHTRDVHGPKRITVHCASFFCSRYVNMKRYDQDCVLCVRCTLTPDCPIVRSALARHFGGDAEKYTRVVVNKKGEERKIMKTGGVRGIQRRGARLPV